MISSQRRSQILQMAESRGFVSLTELLDEVGASESTIRRDLDFLHQQGKLQRTRGGAAFAGEQSNSFDARRFQAPIEKQSIAAHAAEQIKNGETVLLDGGTTTLEIARLLTHKSLHVVTNSIPVASLLMNCDAMELTVIGGFVYPKTGVALGEQAIAALQSVNVTRLVMSAGGVTQDGLFNSNALLVETERKMIECAQHVTLVADSSKFGRNALSHLCPLEAVHEVVTDDGLPTEWQETLTSRGIRLVLAKQAEQNTEVESL